MPLLCRSGAVSEVNRSVSEKARWMQTVSESTPALPLAFSEWPVHAVNFLAQCMNSLKTS
jgi:hypothetical protein